jgi:WD40 repeat protein
MGRRTIPAADVACSRCHDAWLKGATVAVGIPGATPFGGHAGWVNCVAYSPDGSAFATGGGDGEIRIWDAATTAQTRQLTGHAGPVSALAWSPDGAVIASGGEDTTVRFWHVGSAAQIHQLTAHSHAVRAVAWSPDSSRVASAANTVRLWDAATGQQGVQFKGHSHEVRAAAWSPDGATIATGAGTVRLWEAATGEQRAQFTGHSQPVWAVAWSPDGATIATGAVTVRLWDITSGEEIQQIGLGIRGVRALAWRGDGRAVAVGGTNGGTWLLNIRPGTDVLGTDIFEFQGHAGEVTDLAWHPDGATFVTVSHDCTLGVWEPSGRQVARVAGHNGPVFAGSWSPDGTRVATQGIDDAVRIWDAVTGQQVAELDGYPGGARDIAWSPDGSSIATVDRLDAAVRFRDPGTGQDVREPVAEGGRSAGAIAWSPDGSAMAVSVLGNNALMLRDLRTTEQVRWLTGHDSEVIAIAWDPVGAVLATADAAGAALLWDAGTGAPLKRLNGSDELVSCIAWSPDGRAIAAGTQDGGISLWEATAGQQTGHLTGHAGQVNGLAWSPDGTMIASAGLDGTIRIWDPVFGEELRQAVGHTGRAFSVAWRPDGDRLASVGWDGTIRIWNPHSGTQVNGTGFGARPGGRPLAGVSNDTPSDTDLLGVGEDVAMLAELIAATETRPPLAIALIGDWGAGKSSAMLQIEKHVGVLAATARGNPGVSAWAETVRQVRFNAWHYGDDQLWSGLVGHLFDVLAARAGDAEDTKGQVVLDSSRPPTADRAQLKAEQDELRRASDQLDRTLKAADAMAPRAGALSWLVSPWYAVRMVLTSVWQVFRDVRAGLFTLLGWAVLGVAAYAVWHYGQGWLAAVTTAVALVVPPVAAAAAQTRAFVAGQRGKLSASRREYQRRIRSIEDQLILVDAAERLARFLEERGGGGDYRKHQGLLGRVRADLDQLAANLMDARRQWERDGRTGPPPLERIVLYIDDLDRCPPHRVVRVLEAVHLMLALDLFVVVVAVDARWLIKSLEYHHRELFKGGGDAEGAATPIDYLDKIFQIPFTLLPPNPETTADYLRSLLPQPSPVGDRRAPGPRVPEADDDLSGARAADPRAETPAVADPSGGSGTGTGGSERDGETASPPGDPATEPGRPLPDRSGLRYQPGLETAELSRPVRTAGLPEADGAGTVELRPLGLQVSQAEVEFMARLGELLPTPRVAKRLVNLYRLVRIGVRSGELAEFVGDENGAPYQAVQVLLAILVGHPEFAREMFRVILNSAGEGFRERDYADLAAVAAEAGGRGGAPHSFGIVHAFLDKMRDEAPAAVSMAECRLWCPRLARFSFYTRELAGRELGGGASRG